MIGPARAVLLLGLLAGLAPGEAAAQQQQPPQGWQQGGGWQRTPPPMPPGTGIMPLPQANNLAPDLSDNYDRLRRQRQLDERVESGTALFLQGVIPRGR